MWKELNRYYYTLKYLKPKQIYFRIFYFARKVFGNNITLNKNHPQGYLIKFETSLFAKESYKKDGHFELLNIFKNFKSDDYIDWNFSEFGKLWCYNLNYFDFLIQKNMNSTQGLKLINDYISKFETLKDGLEPYPISLRNINWIKFIAIHNIREKKIDSFLYSCYQYLLHNLEYHLLGNHLLENAFSLFIGSIYFDDEKLYKRSRKILENELIEQILDDGAHFELSPMYHHILFERLLDCINFANSANSFNDYSFLEFLTKKAELMLGWMKEIEMHNGDMPLLNDSTVGIAKSANELIQYASEIGIESKTTELSSSGYRKYCIKNWELIADAGKPGPDYIPGHAHADIGNFILYYRNKPFIIDPGISTYEKNKRRHLERSSEFHNTVVINDHNQSDVWGGFRLGQRATAKILEESKDHLKLSHNGYKTICGDHKREFKISDTTIVIHDFLSKDDNIENATAYFHLSKGTEIAAKSGEEIVFNNGLKMIFKNAKSIQIEKYNCPEGFNSYITCDKLAVHFNMSLESKIF